MMYQTSGSLPDPSHKLVMRNVQGSRQSRTRREDGEMKKALTRVVILAGNTLAKETWRFEVSG